MTVRLGYLAVADRVLRDRVRLLSSRRATSRRSSSTTESAGWSVDVLEPYRVGLGARQDLFYAGLDAGGVFAGKPRRARSTRSEVRSSGGSGRRGASLGPRFAVVGQQMLISAGRIGCVPGVVRPRRRRLRAVLLRARPRAPNCGVRSSRCGGLFRSYLSAPSTNVSPDEVGFDQRGHRLRDRAAPPTAKASPAHCRELVFRQIRRAWARRRVHQDRSSAQLGASAS
jgi:hypothetical protein